MTLCAVPRLLRMSSTYRCCLTAGCKPLQAPLERRRKFGAGRFFIISACLRASVCSAGGIVDLIQCQLGSVYRISIGTPRWHTGVQLYQRVPVISYFVAGRWHRITEADIQLENQHTFACTAIILDKCVLAAVFISV